MFHKVATISYGAQTLLYESYAERSPNVPNVWNITLMFSYISRKKMNGDTQPLLQQQQQMVPVQDTYMQSRAEALQNVESTIHELSNIFTQLATMVSQQGELAIRFCYFPFQF